MLRLLLLLVFGLVQRATAVDVKFTEVVERNGVTNLDIKVEYSNNKQERSDYISCTTDKTCPTLNWDDDAQLHISFTFPKKNEFKKLDSVGGKTLGDPVKYKIQACFETEFTKNRKWRKPKPVIQDDKRCSRKIESKKDIELKNMGNNVTSIDVDFKLPSDTPKAEFFITIFIFCRVKGTNDDEYCSFDTTGELSALAKGKEVKDKNMTSSRLSYRTDVIASRPTELVVCVIILSILSVTLLVLYFVYERVMKKTA